MKFVNEPTYKKYITSGLKRFDDRHTGFSRGAVEGDKYTAMHDESIVNIEKLIPGKTIIDHAKWVSGRTVDYLLRKNSLARVNRPIYNSAYRLKNPDPAAITKIVKEMALWIGADLVGVAKLNPLWIYTHWGEHNAMYTLAAKAGDPIEVPPEYKMVVVMAHEMDYDGVRRSPNVESETDIGYSKGAWCAASLATFITELGYKAIPAVNELGLSIPMAVDAGLGEMGRMGQLMTRDYGPRVRISKVFTDLPLVPDKPLAFGVQDFCTFCKKCADVCPSGSIDSGEKAVYAGVEKWQTKQDTCYRYWRRAGSDCALCVKVCPYSHPANAAHDLVRWFIRRNHAARRVALRADDLAYGRQPGASYPYPDWHAKT